MNYQTQDSSGNVTSSGSTGGATGGVSKSVVYAGGNSVSSLAAGGVQDTYFYSTTVGGTSVNTGFNWIADAPGSIIGVSLCNTGSNQAAQNNVQFLKNGANLGALQVLGPITQGNSCTGSFTAGTLSFAKGDAIRVITGNNTAGTFNCEVWFTVQWA